MKTKNLFLLSALIALLLPFAFGLQPVRVAQAAWQTKLPPDLRQLVEHDATGKQTQAAIVQMRGVVGEAARASGTRHGGRVQHQFQSIDGVLAELPVAEIAALAADYGGIVSPANNPKVITVGATKDPLQSFETWSGRWNDKPTPTVNTTANPHPLRRTELQVASYSSRGPTLIDGLVKPDLVAPGTKIMAAASLDIATQTDQIILNTVLPLNSKKDKTIPKMYCQLSGTSFAAPTSPTTGPRAQTSMNSTRPA